MNLQTELERVREYGTGIAPPPSNEANTCDWIIRPLLLQCGYNYHDIHAQGHDAAGGIPDYTILPNSAHTWFLEAKAWQASITDIHVNRAANYVNTTAKRWFVVSNGREWRLYDNHIVQVPPPNRLVATARLDHGTQLEDLLIALSKPSVQSRNLEQYAIKTALNNTLQQELATSTSDMVQAIVNVLKTKSGLYAITPDAVVDYFHVRQVDDDTPLTLPKPPPSPTVPVIQPASMSSFSTTDALTLPGLLAMGKAVEHKQPVVFTFPDGSLKTTAKWRDVAVSLVEWLIVKNKIPLLPFIGGNGKRCYFISTTPFHPTGKKMDCREINVNNQVFYVDMCRSAENFTRRFNELCEEVGEAPEGFRVTLQ